MAGKVVKVDARNPDLKLLQRAARLIVAGEVLVCPTDTGYAFAANGLDEKAVAKVFGLKGRAFTNPIHVTVDTFVNAEKYAFVNEAARKLARAFLPGALTIVLPKKPAIPSILVAGKDTIGIRVPDNKVILGLAALTGRPITSTSANISGQPTPYSTQEVIEQLGSDIDKVALVLDQGELPSRKLSTIIDLSTDTPQQIRPGRIKWEEILSVLERS